MKNQIIINEFIESELNLIKENKTSDGWYAMNWMKLKKKVVEAAPKLLDRDNLILFYSLLLRKSLFFDEAIKENYLEWDEAYRLHTQWMTNMPYLGISSISRLYGNIVFGFDYELTVGKNDGFNEYYLYRQAMKVLGNNIPDMIKRRDRLMPFVNNTKVIERIGKSLHGLHFIHDDMYDTQLSYGYRVNNLLFFHVLLILHLSELRQAKETLADYKNTLPSLPRFKEQMILIGRCEGLSIR